MITLDGKLLIHHNLPLNISPRQVKPFVFKHRLFGGETDDREGLILQRVNIDGTNDYFYNKPGRGNFGELTSLTVHKDWQSVTSNYFQR